MPLPARLFSKMSSATRYRLLSRMQHLRTIPGRPISCPPMKQFGGRGHSVSCVALHRAYMSKAGMPGARRLVERRCYGSSPRRSSPAAATRPLRCALNRARRAGGLRLAGTCSSQVNLGTSSRWDSAGAGRRGQFSCTISTAVQKMENQSQRSETESPCSQ